MGITKLRGNLQIKQGTVGSDRIADRAILADDISLASLTGDLFAPGTITPDKLDGDALAGVGLIYNHGTDKLDVTVTVPVNATLKGNVFNGPSQLVELLGDGKLPILDGSNLTNVVSVPAVFVDQEVPAGLINGSNTVYTLSQVPLAGSLHFYVNGILQRAGVGNDFVLSGAQITMSYAAGTGSHLAASYRV